MGWPAGGMSGSPRISHSSVMLQNLKNSSRRCGDKERGGSGSEDCVGGVQRERQDRVWGMQDPHTDSDRTPRCPNGDCVQELTVQE